MGHQPPSGHLRDILTTLLAERENAAPASAQVSADSLPWAPSPWNHPPHPTFNRPPATSSPWKLIPWDLPVKSASEPAPASLEGLPNELLYQILVHVQNVHSLTLTSRRLHERTDALLYKKVVVRVGRKCNLAHLRQLVCTLANYPDLAATVESAVFWSSKHPNPALDDKDNDGPPLPVYHHISKEEIATLANVIRDARLPLAPMTSQNSATTPRHFLRPLETWSPYDSAAAKIDALIAMFLTLVPNLRELYLHTGRESTATSATAEAALKSLFENGPAPRQLFRHLQRLTLSGQIHGAADPGSVDMMHPFLFYGQSYTGDVLLDTPWLFLPSVRQFQIEHANIVLGTIKLDQTQVYMPRPSGGIHPSAYGIHNMHLSSDHPDSYLSRHYRMPFYPNLAFQQYPKRSETAPVKLTPRWYKSSVIDLKVRESVFRGNALHNFISQFPALQRITLFDGYLPRNLSIVRSAVTQAKDTLTAVKLCGIAGPFPTMPSQHRLIAMSFANFPQVEELSIDMGALLDINFTAGPPLPTLLPQGLKALKITYCRAHANLLLHLRALCERVQAGSFPNLKTVHVDFEYSGNWSEDFEDVELVAILPAYTPLKTDLAGCNVDFGIFDHFGRPLAGPHTTKHSPQDPDNDRVDDWWWPLPTSRPDPDMDTYPSFPNV
ncbi:hypothetical protein BU16DRAFT_556037 [Lophium mytilinum]|uniref:F-box domain-containing protein n=1 Tax=Lophium mytilinum TaxID=390894 RepID=A0A6A6RDN9_9PEZI|nr:hypothetical protein BU16DRAFT_556037 [Lophium mytilinum]